MRPTLGLHLCAFCVCVCCVLSLLEMLLQDASRSSGSDFWKRAPGVGRQLNAQTNTGPSVRDDGQAAVAAAEL